MTLKEYKCNHKWAKLIGEGLVELPIRACIKCGTIRVGRGTIKISPDYIDLSLLTSAPTAVEGRVYYNSTDKKVYHHNGTTWKGWW